MLVLERMKKGKNEIFGAMYLNGDLVCYTLENLEKVIPVGKYKVENSKSPKFKRELPLLYNDTVPASRGIRVHVGNTYKDSIGCVLVGMEGSETKTGWKLLNSQNAETMMTMLCKNQSELYIVESFKK